MMTVSNILSFTELEKEVFEDKESTNTMANIINQVICLGPLCKLQGKFKLQ